SRRQRSFPNCVSIAFASLMYVQALFDDAGKRIDLATPFIPYKFVYSNAPDGNEPLALDMGSTGKGQVWINGESIRRYWMAYGNGGCNSYKYLEMIPLCCKVPTHGKQK
ncbi:hypothetical protein HN51_041547, partial [Arachis hypogaea]